ncbi:MAG: translation initiation factor IF-1 [Mycoplasmataceae bacterium RC_NB112A]|nr:MAG: translation initiation factor IF-1 [Mycoplasmataceae bacterium RC_NB112A]
MKKNKEEFLHEPAEVIKKLPNSRFKVKFNNGKIIEAKIAKRLRRIVVGDWVIVKIPLRDLTNGQIIGLASKTDINY